MIINFVGTKEASKRCAEHGGKRDGSIWGLPPNAYIDLVTHGSIKGIMATEHGCSCFLIADENGYEFFIPVFLAKSNIRVEVWS